MNDDRNELLNVDQVAELLGISKRSVWRHRNDGTIPSPIQVAGSTRWRKTDLANFLSLTVQEVEGRDKKEKVYDVPVDPRDPRLRSGVLRCLKSSTTVEKLVEKLGADVEDIQQVLSDLESSGHIIERRGNSLKLGRSVAHEPSQIVRTNHFVGKPLKFGVVADMHLCSKTERLDVLEAAYDEFARQGINTVLCPGNYVDGEKSFNRYELKVHGIADQCQYCIDHWPQREGIKTFYVDGDDHEGWWQQSEGIEFGKYLMLEAKEQGRTDLEYLGYMEADIVLEAPAGRTIIKVLHAGGGSTYALSYTSQKLAESFQGGEKPHVCVIGHYHKQEYCFPRNVHCVQAGCCQDQTRFMRKKKIGAHVGFCVITLQQDVNGSVTRFQPEFFPFWDRGYYTERDGGVGARLQGRS